MVAALPLRKGTKLLGDKQRKSRLDYSLSRNINFATLICFLLQLASELRRYPSAFVRAEEVRRFHARSAVDALLELPDGDARLALRNFALALAA